ncbi:MAG: RNA polymerase sigma factor [Lachnospiraceae bacterium]|nr:RNA polymerase sigma factor [Lachnospiraceae bacterium]
MFSLTSADKRKADCDAYAVEQCLSGMKKQDVKALEELYYRTSAPVFGFALSILKNIQDAEDVMHDLYVAVWSAAGKYDADGKPMAWIMTITRNLCLQKLREYRKRSDIPQEDWETYINGNLNMSSEDKLILSECLKTLSDEERQIVTLHAVAGFKHREIGKLLEMPLSTILSKYNRALKKLQKYMEESNEDKRN